MRRTSPAVPAALFLVVFVVFTVPAAAQTTKPPGDLAKENAALRAYVENLEARVAELEAKLKEPQKRPSPRADVRPFTPIPPYGYELPQPPFKLTPPAPTPVPPRNNLRIVPPRQSIPENWQRHEFNGQEFYLIPLR